MKFRRKEKLGQTAVKSLSRQNQNYRERGRKCDSSPNFNLEKNALSVVLVKATIVEEDALSVCGSSSKSQLQKKRHQVWFIVKVTTAKEEASSVVRCQNCNCKKRRYFMCDSLSKPQL
ncbi:hypothetical protein H5410_036772 [Solanum commersonii]|uniref:Uncharacterized protein n=1 Tax=Solanum commersonii TaxID=4109 RepID=A0A9J5Y8C9_SOLCO|nr:hypothetical protein H5410_036772 [Solanum commersonii]